jgi:hypothetical protein
MKTTLSPEQLAELHAQRPKPEAFVNPVTINQARRIIRDKGRDWAASVLLRAATAGDGGKR